MKLILQNTSSPERMTQVALAAIRRRPELLQCRVESLLEALTLCMEAGIEPDGRNAHLLAQGDAARVVFDWKGLVALGRRCGVEAIHADLVCQNDTFGVGYDGGAKLTHQVDYRNPRGDAYAVYCYFIIDGEPDVEVMTREEVECGRAAELAACPDSASLAYLWEQDWPAMAKRAVVTRAAMKWPVSAPGALSIPPLETGQEAQPQPPSSPSQNGSTPHRSETPQEVGNVSKTLETLRAFMMARNISEASMLDYLKEEGRIADHITRLAEVPAPVIEDVVSSCVDMMEEEQGI